MDTVGRRKAPQPCLSARAATMLVVLAESERTECASLAGEHDEQRGGRQQGSTAHG